MKRFFLLLLIAAGLIAFYHSRTGGFAPRTAQEELRLSGQVEVRESAPDKPVQVRIQVDEATLGRIQPGQPVRVRTNAGKIYQGRVGLISARVETEPQDAGPPPSPADQAYHLRVIVDKPGPDLGQGLPVTVELSPAGRQFSN